MDDRQKQQKRQYMYALTAVVGVVALGWVLFLGIRWDGFINLWWWLSLLSVFVLIGALIVINRRMFR
jgi:hypothetical protein